MRREERRGNIEGKSSKEEEAGRQTTQARFSKQFNRVVLLSFVRCVLLPSSFLFPPSPFLLPLPPFLYSCIVLEVSTVQKGKRVLL